MRLKATLALSGLPDQTKDMLFLDRQLSESNRSRSSVRCDELLGFFLKFEVSTEPFAGLRFRCRDLDAPAFPLLVPGGSHDE
jgi:hypothetical protein